MGPQLPKPAAWQGLPNVSASLRAQPPWAHLGPEGSWRQRQVAQIQVTSGASASTPGWSRGKTSLSGCHRIPRPLLLWDAGNSSRRASQTRSSSRAGGLLPHYPSKSISIPLCCHPLSPAPPRDELGSVGPGDLWGGGCECSGSFAEVIFRPSRAPESAELVGMEGEGTGMTTAAGTWDVCPSWGAQPTPSPASSESLVPHGN